MHYLHTLTHLHTHISTHARAHTCMRTHTLNDVGPQQSLCLGRTGQFGGEKVLLHLQVELVPGELLVQSGWVRHVELHTEVHLDHVGA